MNIARARGRRGARTPHLFNANKYFVDSLSPLMPMTTSAGSTIKSARRASDSTTVCAGKKKRYNIDGQ